MKTLLFVSVLLFTNAAQKYAYICDSGNTVKYHLDKDCRGLNKCTHEIKKVKLEDAKEEHNPCKLCAI